MRRSSRALLGLAAALAPGAACAEDLAAGISRDKIEITSNFTGTDIVVFGAIENEEGQALPATEMRDVVVVIRSDKPYLVTVRKKERVGPIWMNQDEQRFAGVPGFYFLSSTRPLREIAAAEVLDQFELGLDRIVLGPAPGSVGGPRANFARRCLRNRIRDDLYSQHEGGGEFSLGLAVPHDRRAAAERAGRQSARDGLCVLEPAADEFEFDDALHRQDRASSGA